MDKEQARFILRSFRPDGADTSDADFAAALQLTTQDRELGQWFARERASDAEFSEALHTIELPDTLRNEILDSLAWQRGDMPHTESPEDNAWAHALSTITAPPGLRETIITAMHACAVSQHAPVAAWKKFGIPLAAAVALVLTLPSTVWKADSSTDTASLESSSMDPADPLSPLRMELIRAGFISTYENPGFTLDTGRASHREIMRQLEERGLPCPTCLPPSLRNIEGLGCREIIIDGHRGAVICYEHSEGSLVHLIIFRIDEIEDPLPYRNDAHFAQHGDWAAAAWRNNENAFVLLGHTDVSHIASLF